MSRPTLAGLSPVTGMLLSGCDMAVFEAPPGDALSACDSRFVGHWRLDPPPAGSDAQMPTAYLVVERECSSYHLVLGQHSESIPPDSEAYAESGGRSIVALRALNARTKDRQAAPAQPGYVCFAYESAGRTIRLHPVTDQAAAHLIIDVRVAGRVNIPTGAPPSDFEPLSVRLMGDSSAMAQVAHTPGLMSNTHPVLTPVSPGDVPDSITGDAA